jgi:hypothetical protein
MLLSQRTTAARTINLGAGLKLSCTFRVCVLGGGGVVGQRITLVLCIAPVNSHKGGRGGGTFILLQMGGGGGGELRCSISP